jgi:hypothetical protein
VKKAAAAAIAADKAAGTLRSWEPVKGAGNFGCGIVMAPASVADAAEADANSLLVAALPASGPATYWAGFGWDQGGDIADLAAWDAYLAQFARRLAAPVQVTVAAK